MATFDFESEFMFLESELVFLAHAVEQSLENMHDFTGNEADAHAISYGFHQSSERLLTRFRELTGHAVRELI